MLGRNPNNNIIVVGEKEDQARDVASFAKCGSHVVMDVKKEDGRLVELIDQSNVVISLFPVPMHTRIAELCVDRQTDMVTASYESTDMRKLQKRYV